MRFKYGTGLAKTAAVLGVAAALAGCSLSAATVGPEEEIPVAVETAVVGRGALSAAVEIVGTAAPSADLSVLPKMTGELVAVEVGEGDVVEKGDILARIDSESLEIQLELEQLALEQAQLQYKNLHASGAAQSQLDQAEHSVRQAELRVRLARLNLGNATVSAPISGLVTNVSARAGGFAATGSPLLRIVALDPIRIDARVDARAMVELQGRRTLPVEFPDVGAAGEAVVTAIGTVADASGFYTLEAELANADERVKPGMLASIRLERELVPASLLVPTSAIVERGGASLVYVVRDGRAVETELTIVESQSARTAVEGELAEGDEIVVKGQYMLADGSAVTVVRADGEAAK